ncbi:peptidylprolyl isomerase [Rhodococcus jostii]|uniref:peptidylprolyl isomerase n=1 Tax=Rhodococcus jostii TaxID=132919 RepID=UPI003644C1BB
MTVGARIRVAAVSAAVLACVAGCADPLASPSAEPTTSTRSPTDTGRDAVDPSRIGALPSVPPLEGPVVDCRYLPGGPAARPVTLPPRTGIHATGTVVVDLATSGGPVGVVLDREKAPCTVNSFIALAGQGFFDDTPCHRLVTSGALRALQCGDPSGTGTGGPGYRFATEYPETDYPPKVSGLGEIVRYPRGTVVMAHTGRPASNGSQFFLVYADSMLPPTYTVFGRMTEDAVAVVEKVAASGDDGSGSAGVGAPNIPVRIDTATGH